MIKRLKNRKVKYFFKFIIAIFVVNLIGCKSSNQYTYRCIQTYNIKKENNNCYTNNICDNSLVNFEMKIKKIIDEPTKKMINFEIKFENLSKNFKIEFPLKSYILLDDNNHRFDLKPEDVLSKLVLTPKSTGKVSLSFLLPKDYNFSTIGSFRLLWSYKVKDNIYKMVSKFLRYSIEYRYKEVYYPCWGLYPYGSIGIYTSSKW